MLSIFKTKVLTYTNWEEESSNVIKNIGYGKSTQNLPLIIQQCDSIKRLLKDANPTKEHYKFLKGVISKIVHKQKHDSVLVMNSEKLSKAVHTLQLESDLGCSASKLQFHDTELVQLLKMTRNLRNKLSEDSRMWIVVALFITLLSIFV